MEDFWTVKEMFMMDNLKIIMLKDLEDIYQKEEQLSKFFKFIHFIMKL